MSIYSCRTDAGWLGFVSQDTPLGSAAADFVFDLPRPWAFVVGSVVTGLGLYLLVAGVFSTFTTVGGAGMQRRLEVPAAALPDQRMWSIDLWLRITNITLGSVLSGFLAYWIYASVRVGSTSRCAACSILGSWPGTVLCFLITDVVIYWAHRIFHRPALFRPHPPVASPQHGADPAFTRSHCIQGGFRPTSRSCWYRSSSCRFRRSASSSSFCLRTSGRSSSTPGPLVPVIPWMPSTYFHDDHHRFFSVNYGQHLILWDRIFGSLRHRPALRNRSVRRQRGAAHRHSGRADALYRLQPPLMPLRLIAGYADRAWGRALPLGQGGRRLMPPVPLRIQRPAEPRLFTAHTSPCAAVPSSGFPWCGGRRLVRRGFPPERRRRTGCWWTAARSLRVS